MSNETKDKVNATGTQTAAGTEGAKAAAKEQKPKAAKAKTESKAKAKTEPSGDTTPKAKASDSRTTIGKKVLERNPTLKEVHITADGRSFYHKCDATNHGRTLTNKTVETVTR